MLKYKAYLLINMLGLTIAIACTLLAVTFVLDELEYDQFHSKKENIYRLYKRNVNTTLGTERLTYETSGLMGPTMVSEYPEVLESVRLASWFEDVVISFEDENFKTDNFVFADSNFFKVFDFELIAGDFQKALANPSSIVLTETMAARLFGDTNPLGMEVVGIHDIPMTVTGIVKDPTRYSHIQFGALASWSTMVPNVGPLSYNFFNNWLAQTLNTYLLVQENASVPNLEAKFPDFMQRNFPERADSYFLKLKPFTEVYLYSDNIQGNRLFPVGSAKFLKTFSIIALFILLIACVNYVNISTAKATKRAGEVSIRKVMGAKRKQLIFQFVGESVVLTLLASALALLLADISVGYFNELTGKSLAITAAMIPQLAMAVVVILIAVSALSGIYPALVLSSFQPIKVLKSSNRTQTSGSNSRQVLTVVQFAVSIILIAGTLLVSQQLTFLQDKELGFDKDRILVLNTNNDIGNNLEAFRNELESYANVKSVSICQAAIGAGNFGTTIIAEGSDEEMSVQSFRVDHNFLKTYGIEIVEGREFDPTVPPQQGNLIVNEKFVELAGWDDPLQRKVRFSAEGPQYPVIGVAKNFHYNNPDKWALDPVVMFIFPTNYYNASIKIGSGDIQQTLGDIENLWNKYESRFPFDYFFVDQWFDSKYKQYQKLLQTVTTFAGISILIACLGLYGLTAFTIEQKTKEIGIRKVFGASVSGLTFMINRRFMLLVLVAFTISSPITYYFIDQWLATFAYQINVGIMPFVVAGLFALFIAVAAVSVQALKAAVANPIKAIGHE